MDNIYDRLCKAMYKKWTVLKCNTENVNYDVTGGNGYINDYPTGRLLRNAKLYEIGAGTSEIRRLIIGRDINAEYSS